jgi:cell division septal protein FtsQ
MFNNSLFDEEAKLKISEREQEAEAHRRHQQLGYRDQGITRWIVVVTILVLALILTLALL